MNPAWIIRLEQEIESYTKIIEQELKQKLTTIRKYPLEEILKTAISQKKYDIYHSTTIEGYTITPQEVEDILLGTGPREKKSFEKIRNKMAIIGHSHAFEYIIGKIKEDFNRPILSSDLFSEIYFRLFKPSVDAKIINKYDFDSLFFCNHSPICRWQWKMWKVINELYTRGNWISLDYYYRG